MPWCPTCKTEYEEGTEACPKCGAALTGLPPEQMACLMSLPEEQASGLLAYYEYLGYSCCAVSRNAENGLFDVLVPAGLKDVLSGHAASYLEENPEISRADAQDAKELLRPSGSAYIEKSKQLEDIRSTAFAFLVVGLIGLAAVALVIAGILPFPFTGSGKALTLAVMGALFIIFTAVGISNTQKINGLKKEAEAEQAKTRDAVEQFLAAHTASSVDEGLALTGTLEQDYYLRIEKIRSLLGAQGSESSAYEDYLLEQIYAGLYEQAE